MNLTDALFTFSLMISTQCCATEQNSLMTSKTQDAISAQYGDIIENKIRRAVMKTGIPEDYIANTLVAADIAINQRIAHSIKVFSDYDLEGALNNKDKSVSVLLKKTF